MNIKPLKHLTNLMILLPLGFLAAFYFLPIGEILARSLINLNAVLEVFASERLAGVIRFTFYQAFLSTLLTVLIAIPLAVLFHFYKFKLRSFLYLLVGIPFMLPTVVVAAAFNAFIGVNGWVNLLLRSTLPGFQGFTFTGTLWAILFAHVFYNTIIVVRMTRAAWENLNPDLESAARALGSSPFTAWHTVTLPNLLPAILAASLLVFFFDFTSFGVILMLGGPQFSTIETEIYKQTMNFLDLNTAGVLSLIQILFSTIFSIIYSHYLSRNQNPPSKIKHRAAKNPDHWREKVFVLFSGMFTIIFFLLPILSVPIRSVLSISPVRGSGEIKAEFTTHFFSALFQNPRDSYFFVPPYQAIWNSLSYAGITILLCLLIAIPTVILFRQKPELKKWVEPALVLPLGTSSVTLGLGYILFFNFTPFWLGSNLLTTPLLLPFAHTTIALPFVLRSILTALEQIPASYASAAAVLGADAWQRARTLYLPMLKKPLLSATAFSFTISLGEFGAASLLTRPDYPTLPTAIYRFISQPGASNYGQAMAMTTILLVFCGIGIFMIERDSFKSA